jgi:hypothetical protein
VFCKKIKGVSSGHRIIAVGKFSGMYKKGILHIVKFISDLN